MGCYRAENLFQDDSKKTVQVFHSLDATARIKNYLDISPKNSFLQPQFNTFFLEKTNEFFIASSSSIGIRFQSIYAPF